MLGFLRAYLGWSIEICCKKLSNVVISFYRNIMCKNIQCIGPQALSIFACYSANQSAVQVKKLDTCNTKLAQCRIMSYIVQIKNTTSRIMSVAQPIPPSIRNGCRIFRSYIFVPLYMNNQRKYFLLPKKSWVALDHFLHKMISTFFRNRGCILNF